jgi:hypothetical protein
MSIASKQVLVKPAFFVCDIQERFRPAIHEFTCMVATSRRLLEIARVRVRIIVSFNLSDEIMVHQAVQGSCIGYGAESQSLGIDRGGIGSLKAR